MSGRGCVGLFEIDHSGMLPSFVYLHYFIDSVDTRLFATCV